MATNKIHLNNSNKQANAAQRLCFSPFGTGSDAFQTDACNGGAQKGAGERELFVADNHHYRYKSIMVSRSVPVLFIIACFLIIASIRCDRVDSANVEALGAKPTKRTIKETETTNLSGEQASTARVGTTAAPAKYDLLSMLREIYLDHNSKVITMILPQAGDPVQKFHTNGRYGRRTVASFAEAPSAHAEFGKLSNRIINLGSLKSILQSQNRIDSNDGQNTATKDNSSGNSRLTGSPYQYANQAAMAALLQLQQQQQAYGDGSSSTTPLDDLSLTNLQSELGKLLKCNYMGVSNLYWCDTVANN